MTHGGRLTLVLLFLLAGCNEAPLPGSSQPTSEGQATVLLSVTSDALGRPQSVDMAMKLAGFSLDEGRQVVMFFNVKGVKVPVTALAEDLAFQDNSPIKTQLAELIERGVDVHVCPICMKALDVQASDLIEGAQVTTRPALFANIGTKTAVFTY